MPLSMVNYALPPHLTSVYAVNVDADTRKELVLASQIPAGDAPDKVQLTVLHISASGQEEGRTLIDLGNKAQLWDADGAIYVQDKDGIVRYDGNTPVRVVSQSTPLSAMGATTPVHAKLLHDIDNDGSPEIVMYASGKIYVYRKDGTSLGAVSAASEGALSVDQRMGAEAIEAAIHPPAYSLGDIDGDGWQDLLLPAHGRLRVWFGSTTFGSRSLLMTLPLDLEPRDTAPVEGEVKKDIGAVWMEDIDGDHKIDLAVQRYITDGSFFGASSELLYWKGTGTSFSNGGTLSMPSAAFGVELRDQDGDGDKDWLAPEVDVGMGNLARAMMSKEVRVDLRMYAFNSGTFSATPTLMRTLSYPIDKDGRFQAEFSADIDGDGRLDLVTNDAEDRVRVYRGSSGGLETTAAWDQPLEIPLGNGTIFVSELTGDNRAEIFVWGPDAKTGTLLRLP